MASVEVSKLSSQEVAELACTYAALILHDDEQDITGTHPTNSGDKIGKLIQASGVKVEPYWPKVFAKALEGKDISSFFNFGGSAAPAATEAAPAKKEEKKKEEKKKEAPPPPKEEEEEMDMGDLFG